MKTSSGPKPPVPPDPHGDHWSELAELIPAEPKDEFADWIDEKLAHLETELTRFVTNKSLKNHLRR